ncbi:alpha/beta fold hydrolase [Streptomyces sp. NBRC 109706]|uniref:alpha/beta fold hydrolase n=1 Tax=Streptomyces sp. NBRC 109706 TaxID=1550035 RepID=UPI00083204EC|nr:alpha/beta hydrolase [Streptomyces sp. NBRC 109706]
MTGIYRSLKAHRDVTSWCAERLAGWPVDHRTTLLETSLGRTHVVMSGEGTGPEGTRVVLVPGTNFNAATSLSLATSLAERWSTSVVDVPGQPGLSDPRRPGRQRLAVYGRWLSEVLDRLGHERVVVVGHSLGGGIALACPAPQIRGRILVAPAGLVGLKVTGDLLMATVPWFTRPTEVRSARLLRHLYAPGVQPPAEIVAWMTLLARSCRSSLAPAPLPGHLLARGLSPIDLVATGEHDVFLPPSRLMPAASQRLGLSVRTLPGAGHLAVEEQPEAIVNLVEQAMNNGEKNGC